MTENIVEVGSRYVSDVQDINKSLVEKTLRMRALAYLSQVKSHLLVETIYDMNWSRKVLQELSTALEARNKEAEEKQRIIERQKQQLESQIRSDREQAAQALQESERCLQAFLNELEDAVWIKSRSSSTIYLNDACEQIYGHPKEAFQRDPQLWKALIHPQDRERVLGQSGQLYRQGRIRHQYRIVRPNGQIRWVDDRKHALYDADGELIQLGGMVSDITEQTLTEEALRRTQKMDAVGQLTGGIAHDFNNILAITQGNLDQLEHQVHGNERALEQVGAIRRSTERGVNLTRQLLGFSRGKAARVALTDINQLIAGMDNLLRRSLTPEVEVERRFEPHLWLTEIDPGDFEDAFLNLILNAKDAMRGRGRLQLETANCTVAENGSAQQPNTPPGDYVKLTVTDNGSGIPVADREHIFEPFFTTKQRGKGTGLGLAMVFGFSKRSGGLISFTSQLGEGTSFQLYLPRARHREESLDEALRRENPVAEAAGGNEKILVVEDERDLLDLAEESLAALGYHVISARNGPQALEILEEEPDIALLFSDVVMPGGMNGYELAERASNRNPEIRILLTSGYISRSATDPELSRLHADLLNKPYTHSELAQRIRNLLTG